MRVPKYDERNFFDERGFTLAELIASVAVFGVLVSISVVILFGVLEQRRVDAAATQFVSDFRLAHASASNQLTDWRVVFMPDGSPLSGCGESVGADYCVVKLESSYVGGPGAVPPRIVEFVPREFPEGTKIKRANFDLDCAGGSSVAAVPPSVCGTTHSLEFNSDGTTRTLRPGVSASLIIASADGVPSHRVSFRTPTSRVRIVRNCENTPELCANE